ncbi:MAG TPA: hypothetical protein VHG52_07330 [Thermomicrobiales bacterium]|nr:hypothetical protein [Thermomicrobiales bacterium]
MNEMRFDTMARGLARLSSRRRVLSGMLGTALTVSVGSSAVADRRRARRARRGNRGENETVTASDYLPEGALVGGVWDETLEICHFDPETGGYRIVSVSTVAVPEQLERGDTLYIDCCVDTDCTSTECLTATGCVSGACSFDVALNASCSLGNGVYGICRSDAVCVPVSS